MPFFFRLAAMLLFTFLASSCQERIQPIYVPVDIAIPEALHTASLADISNAIIEGGTLAGWKMTPVSPGKVRATLNIRTHQADVDVDFTTTKYSITYVSSKNLLSQGARIHKAYNQWLRELETAINTGLYEARVKRRPSTVIAEPSNASSDWFSIQDSTDGKVFLSYMERYPESEYAPLARARLAELLDAPKKAVKFDPTGLWQVTATYKEGLGNTSWCARDNRWIFVRDFRKGRISETFWSGNAALYVTGENADEFVDLNFDYPGGGHQWTWTERFRLDSSDKRFTATSKDGGIPPGCKGTIDVHMTKR